jgi:hypothetical protein
VLVETQRLDVQSESDTTGRLSAGEPADEDMTCAACGYGVGPHRLLPTCPMCRGLVWEPRGLARLAAGRHPAR